MGKSDAVVVGAAADEMHPFGAIADRESQRVTIIVRLLVYFV